MPVTKYWFLTTCYIYNCLVLYGSLHCLFRIDLELGRAVSKTPIKRRQRHSCPILHRYLQKTEVWISHLPILASVFAKRPSPYPLATQGSYRHSTLLRRKNREERFASRHGGAESRIALIRRSGTDECSPVS